MAIYVELDVVQKKIKSRNAAANEEITPEVVNMEILRHISFIMQRCL